MTAALDRTSAPEKRRPAVPRVAYIIGTYPSLTTTFIDRELETLREMGVETGVVSIRRPHARVAAMDEYRALCRQVVYLLPVNWIRLLLAHVAFATRRPPAYFGTLFHLLTRPHPDARRRLMTLLHFAEGVLAAYHLRGGGYDHVHAHFLDRASTVALCVGRLLALPYSLTAHAADIYTGPVLLHEKLREAKFVVTVSAFNKQYLLKQVPGLDPSSITVLHPWVDTAEFDPMRISAAETHGARPFTIVSVGRLVEKKGHHNLVEACRLLQRERVDFVCHIVGDGPERPVLESFISRHDLGSRVRLHGGQPQRVVLELLRHADVFALACVVAADGDRDGMPVALAEAMAMGVPVISTSLVGIGELVQPGAGYLVPPGDADALAQALLEVELMGAGDRRAMGERARAIIIREFELAKGTRQLVALFAAS